MPHSLAVYAFQGMRHEYDCGFLRTSFTHKNKKGKKHFQIARKFCLRPLQGVKPLSFQGQYRLIFYGLKMRWPEPLDWEDLLVFLWNKCILFFVGLLFDLHFVPHTWGIKMRRLQWSLYLNLLCCKPDPSRWILLAQSDHKSTLPTFSAQK